MKCAELTGFVEFNNLSNLNMLDAMTDSLMHRGPDEHGTKIFRQEPLLDHRIIEFAAQLPIEYKYKDGIKKRILRDLIHNYLPVTLMDWPKMGSRVPLESWLRKALKEQVNFYLGEKRLEQQGMFNKQMVNNIKINFEKGEDIHGETIWNMLMFEMWFEKWA